MYNNFTVNMTFGNSLIQSLNEMILLVFVVVQDYE